MEKVKVTKEEYEKIHQFKKGSSSFEAIQSFILDDWYLDFTPEQMALILCGWYEVEPEFKVGDWVTEGDGRFLIGTITDVKSTGVVYVEDSRYEVPQLISIKNVRHATPSEIADEKERRWWKKHGRDVNEYKSADVIRIENGIGLYEVVDNYDNKRLTVTSDFANTEFAIYVDEAKLVAPVENRLDLEQEK